MIELRDFIVAIDKRAPVSIVTNFDWTVHSGILGDATLDVIGKYLDRDIIYINSKDGVLVIEIN